MDWRSSWWGDQLDLDGYLDKLSRSTKRVIWNIRWQTYRSIRNRRHKMGDTTTYKYKED